MGMAYNVGYGGSKPPQASITLSGCWPPLCAAARWLPEGLVPKPAGSGTREPLRMSSRAVWSYSLIGSWRLIIFWFFSAKFSDYDPLNSVQLVLI